MKTLDAATIDMINEEWENNEFTTMMWEIISQGQFAELTSVLREHPELAHIRSEDGRGPMWWAYEYQKPKVVSLLKKLGVSDERTDANGVKAIDLKK
jgi:dolichyl-diphosphooligosaccharide---protein glycosyltransferase